MKTITHALLGFVAGTALLAMIALTTGCSGRKPKPVHVANVPYHAHFDSAHCRYMPDGIRFRCRDVVFDPQQIDAKTATSR